MLYCEGERGGEASLKIMDLRSGAVTVVIDKAKALDSPMWTPKGDRVAVVAPGDQQRRRIVSMALDGSDQQDVVPETMAEDLLTGLV